MTFHILHSTLEHWCGEADSETVHRLADFVEWASPHASRLGLTRYAEATEFARGLVAPTLALFRPELRHAVRTPVLDFGAGSGALGITVALLWPAVRVTLADRRQRAVHFMELACARFGIDNAEAYVRELALPPTPGDERYALVLLRAFAPTNHALGMAIPWTASGGSIALWHRPPPPMSCGLELVHTSETTVSDLQLSVYRPDAEASEGSQSIG